MTIWFYTSSQFESTPISYLVTSTRRLTTIQHPRQYCNQKTQTKQ